MPSFEPYKRIQDSALFPGAGQTKNISLPTKVGNLTAAAYAAYSLRAYAGIWFYGPPANIEFAFTNVPMWSPVSAYWKDFASVQAGPVIFQYFTSGRYPEHSGGFAHWPSGEANYAGFKNDVDDDSPAQYEDEYFTTYSSSPQNKRLINLAQKNEESWLDNKPHPLIPAQRATTETQGTDYSLFASDGIGTKKEDDADEQQSPFWYDRESKGGPFLSNSSGVVDSGQDVQVFNPYIHYIAKEPEEDGEEDGEEGGGKDLGYRIDYKAEYEELKSYIDIYSTAYRNNRRGRGGVFSGGRITNDPPSTSTDPSSSNVTPNVTTPTSSSSSSTGGY